MRAAYLLISFSLLICIFIYVFFRPEEVLMHRVALALVGGEFLSELKALIPFQLPDWAIYNLPGALWLYAALLALSSVSHQLRPSTRIVPALVIIAVPIGMEFFQLFHLTDGTFDPMDLLFFGLGIIATYPTLHLMRDKSLEKQAPDLHWRWVVASFLAILFFGDQFH